MVPFRKILYIKWFYLYKARQQEFQMFHKYEVEVILIEKSLRKNMPARSPRQCEAEVPVSQCTQDNVDHDLPTIKQLLVNQNATNYYNKAIPCGSS